MLTDAQAKRGSGDVFDCRGATYIDMSLEVQGIQSLAQPPNLRCREQRRALAFRHVNLDERRKVRVTVMRALPFQEGDLQVGRLRRRRLAELRLPAVCQPP